MEGEGFVVVFYFEHDGDTVEIKDTEVVFLVRVVGVTKVIEHGDGFDQAFDSFGSECGDPGCDDGSAAQEVLSQFVVKRARAFRVRLRGHGWILQNVCELFYRARSAPANWVAKLGP